MTVNEQYAEIGRAHVTLAELRRAQMCRRNRLSRLSKAISSTVLAIDQEDPVAGGDEGVGDIDALLADIRRDQDRIIELKAFLAKVS